MIKLLSLAGATALLLLSTVQPQHEMFSKYKSVEAYEIRPGILAMPTYAEDGQICEIGLEGRHYSPEKIRLNPELSRKEIDEIFDELSPVSERGSRPKNLLERGAVYLSGRSMVENEEYENVSIRIYSGFFSASNQHETVVGDVAVTITWKHRKCP